VCLAIPGRIVELDSENVNLAVVDVVGVRGCLSMWVSR
jgi:hydrogenase maturation factor